MMNPEKKTRSEILQRNLRLVTEVSRLQTENRELKGKISQLVNLLLKTKPSSSCKAVQTDISLTPIHDPSDDVKPPLFQRKRLSRRSSMIVTPQRKLIYDFVTPNGDQWKEDEENPTSETVKKNPRNQRVRFTSHSPLIIVDDERNWANSQERDQESVVERVNRTLSSRICTPHSSKYDANRIHSFSEQPNSEKIAKQKELNMNEDNYETEAAHKVRKEVRNETRNSLEIHGNPSHEMSWSESSVVRQSHRPQRAARRPVTYKEHSLKDKVRKGYQFFSFVDVGQDISSTSL